MSSDFISKPYRRNQIQAMQGLIPDIEFKKPFEGIRIGIQS